MSLRTLPPELIGAVARNIWEDGYGLRTPTITACMLVNSTFAREFRRYLFHTLRLNDFSFPGDPGKAGNYLNTCNAILQQKPEYAAHVKNVVVALESILRPTTNAYLAPGNLPLFATLLEKLNSIESIFMGTPITCGALDLESVPMSVQGPLLELCALPSVTTIVLDRCINATPAYFFRTPKLKVLKLQDAILNNAFIQPEKLDCVWPPRSTDSKAGEELVQQRPFHLDLRGVIGGLAEFPKSLGGVTDLTAHYYRGNHLLIQQAVGAASKSGFLRSIDLEFDLRQLEMPNAPDAPVKFTLTGAHYLHTVRFKIRNAREKDPHKIVLALAESLETLPSPSKLETVHLAIEGLSVTKSDALIRVPLPATTAAVQGQAQGPGPGVAGANAGGAGGSAVGLGGAAAPATSAASSTSSHKVVPWAKLDKLLANEKRFPSPRQVTLEVSLQGTSALKSPVLEGVRSSLRGVLPALKEGVLRIMIF